MNSTPLNRVDEPDSAVVWSVLLREGRDYTSRGGGNLVPPYIYWEGYNVNLEVYEYGPGELFYFSINQVLLYILLKHSEDIIIFSFTFQKDTNIII